MSPQEQQWRKEGVFKVPSIWSHEKYEEFVETNDSGCADRRPETEDTFDKEREELLSIIHGLRENLNKVRELLAERINQAEVNFGDTALATQLREIRDAAGL